MREKLIELIMFADEICHISECKECRANGKCFNHRAADILIANGVTIQKWIPVTESLPEKDVDVLCSRGNHIGALMDVYTYINDNYWEDSYGYLCRAEDEGITHWMPLPTPPKEK